MRWPEQLIYLRTVPTFGTVHMFCASLDCSRNRVSFKWAVSTIAEVFLKALNWRDPYQRRHYHRCLNKCKNSLVSSYLNLTSLKEKHKYNELLYQLSILYLLFLFISRLVIG